MTEGMRTVVFWVSARGHVDIGWNQGKGRWSTMRKAFHELEYKDLPINSATPLYFIWFNSELFSVSVYVVRQSEIVPQEYV